MIGLFNISPPSDREQGPFFWEFSRRSGWQYILVRSLKRGCVYVYVCLGGGGDVDQLWFSTQRKGEVGGEDVDSPRELYDQ